ncbi:MAG: HNH endonuclease [Pseudomonadota bacterium]|nr:HNH endonuclease [Pseudomonadota bacterium]
MAVSLVVAVTDTDWFEMLRHRPDLDEVNFWSPSDRDFKALTPGELFLFKLRAPYNAIVGGGVFAHATSMPWTLAWQAFGHANGATGPDEMRRRIARYRRAETADRSDFRIGCRILTQPFFLDESDWIPVPGSWSRNIVSFKTWSTDDTDGLALWDAVQDRVSGQLPPPAGLREEAPRFGAPQLVRPRLGQGAFRLLVTDIYDRRCAVSGEKTLPALEAAHIRPYADGGRHEASNGLLLRRDIHSLFDAGYVTVTPDLRFEVSRRIKEEFENGRHYYALHGQAVRTPGAAGLQPDPSALTWHNDNRFNG